MRKCISHSLQFILLSKSILAVKFDIKVGSVSHTNSSTAKSRPKCCLYQNLGPGRFVEGGGGAGGQNKNVPTTLLEKKFICLWPLGISSIYCFLKHKNVVLMKEATL